MSAWLDDPENRPPPVTVRQGRKVELKWKRGHARIDDRVYLPPKAASQIEIKLQKDSLRVLVPEFNDDLTRIRLKAYDRARSQASPTLADQ